MRPAPRRFTASTDPYRIVILDVARRPRKGLPCRSHVDTSEALRCGWRAMPRGCTRRAHTYVLRPTLLSPVSRFTSRNYTSDHFSIGTLAQVKQYVYLTTPRDMGSVLYGTR